MSNNTHKCTQCTYTTGRKYNLERHMGTNHNMLYVASDNIQNNEEIYPKNEEKYPKNDVKYPENEETHPENVVEFKCKGCYKNFQTKWGLVRHNTKCKKIKNALECEFCHKILPSQSALSHHRKGCSKCTEITINNKTQDIPEVSVQNINTQQNIETQNNTVIQKQLNDNSTTNNVTINVLKFPE